MKLNNEGKDELRKYILMELDKVPEGVKIHIDKDILEELIFEKIGIYNHSKIHDNKTLIGVGKYIIWSGSFLKKIDLSEVSFDDVLWNRMPYYAVNPIYKGKLSKKIDLSNTNAKVDFSKSFNVKYNYYGYNLSDKDKRIISLEHINFSNVDLSNSHFELVKEIRNVNLDNTNASICFDDGLRMSFSSLRGIDLSMHTISAVNLTIYNFEIKFEVGDEKRYNYCDVKERLAKMGYKAHKNIDILDCNLENTGINITYGENEKVLYNNVYHMFPNFKKELSVMMKSGKLDGCYLNGKKILTKEERLTIKSKKREEYEQMKNNIFDFVSKSIEENTLCR